MVLATTVLASTLISAGAVTVGVSHDTRRVINGKHMLDRMQWFNVHSAPGDHINWRDEDVADFVSMNAYLGRAFVFSSRMAGCTEDATRPGYVNATSLKNSCQQHPLTPDNWPAEAVDFVHSSKTEQLFANSCEGPGGPRPKGFVPASPDATAEFFELFVQHCMMPSQRDRYIVEVANECNVKADASACGADIQHMADIHHAVAERLKKASKPTLVCGPTAAFPEFEMHDFRQFRDVFTPFLDDKSLDCLSMHYYDTYLDTEASDKYRVRSGSNLEALLDLQEAYSATVRGTAMPLLVSEYGSGFQLKPVEYSPLHDFWVLRGVNSKLMQFLDRPDRILKTIPFIVDKATWHDDGAGAKESYPWVLWRNPSGDGKTWQETHLHKFYKIWSEVRGTHMLAESSALNLQVQAFRADEADTSLFVVLNSLQTEPLDVDLDWMQELTDAKVDGTISRLFLNQSSQVPVLLEHSFQGAVPSKLSMEPEELVILKVVPSKLTPLSRSVQETTSYATKTMEPLTQEFSTWNVKLAGSGQAATGGLLRVGIAAPVSELEAVLSGMTLEVNGQQLPIDGDTQLKGKRHISGDGVFMGALELNVPASAVKGVASDSLAVRMRSSHGNATVSSVVMVLRSAEDVVLV